MNLTLLDSLLAQPLLNAIGWVLVHFLWQGFIIGALVLAFRFALPTRAVRFRYRVSGMGLLVLACLPVATLIVECSRLDHLFLTAQSLPRESTVIPIEKPTGLAQRSVQPQTAWRSADLASVGVQDDFAAERETADQTAHAGTGPLSWLGRLQSRASSWLPWIVLVWVTGVTVLALRIVLGLWRISRWKREATQPQDANLVIRFQRLAKQMGIDAAISVMESARASVPAVMGWMRPVVLVPSSMISGLTTEELNAILAHELAHVRRHDYLLNLLQVLVETMLFYHPMVWWLSRTIRLDRELCCDDLAVETCGDRRSLARALARMEEIRCCDEQLSLAANGGSLMGRIQRLVGQEPVKANHGKLLIGFLISLFMFAGVIGTSSIMGGPARANATVAQGTVAAQQQLDSGDPIDEDGYSISRRETTKTDTRTGNAKGVFSDVQLAVKSPEARHTAKIDMLYSNVLPYSFVTERIAKQLSATELGVINFGEKPEPRPRAYQSIATPQDREAAAKQPPESSLIESPDAPPTITVDQLTEPGGTARVVPYSTNEIWVPGHLAVYGMNRTDQRAFKIVRISRVDLGVGPAFGPVNALVLDDDNSDFGIIGRDWAKQPKGEQGESLWFAADGTFHFIVGPDTVAQSTRPDESRPGVKPPKPLPRPLPKTGNSIRVESSRAETMDPRQARPEVRTIKTLDYSTGTRISKGWVRVDGADVPVDVGLEHDGVMVYMSMFFDILAVDAESKELLWKHDWNKSSPIWRTVSIVEHPQREEGPPLVELFAHQSQTRQLTYRYLNLRDGSVVEDVGGERPAGDTGTTPTSNKKAESSAPIETFKPYDQDDDVLRAAEELGDWSDADRIPFRSRGYMQVAQSLMRFPEKRRIRLLKEMGKRRLEGPLVVLCRMLFEANEGGTFRRPMLGSPVFYGAPSSPAGRGVDLKRFPLEPIVLLDEVPICVVRGYDLGGEPEAADSYLNDCLKNCRWTQRDFQQIETKLQKAREALPKASFWGDRVDINDWRDIVILQNQIRPTVLIRIQPQPWVNVVQPLYMLHGTERVDADKLVDELRRDKVPLEAEIQLLVDPSARYQWVVETLDALQDGGFESITVTSWPSDKPQRDEPQNEPQNEPQDKDANEDEESDDTAAKQGWGPKPVNSDLRLKLSLEEGRRAEGEAVTARLEIKNFGDQPQNFDPQYYTPFRVVRVSSEEGRPDLFIGSTPQTTGFEVKLEPGEVYRIWDEVDIAELFLLQRGKYRVHVAQPARTGGRLPESASLALEITDGRLLPRKRLVLQLVKALPEGWKVSTGFGAIYLSHSPTNLKRDVTTIQIWFTAEELPDDFALGEGRLSQVVTRMGESSLGFMNVAAPANAQRLWPDHLRVIEQAATRELANNKGQPDPPEPEPRQPPAAQPKPPWRVQGRVSDGSGEPVPNAEVVAYCGAGTLRQTGLTRTDESGEYVLDFGPGIMMQDKQSLQAATIYVRHEGYFEKDLGRQGDLLAALQEPDDVKWGDRTLEHVVVPGKPKTVDFVLLPAATLKGILRSSDGKPLEGFRVSLTGPELPPSSSVIAQVRTLEDGTFELSGIPTGYSFQLMVAPKEAKPPWLAWASPNLSFLADQQDRSRLSHEADGEAIDLSFRRLDVTIRGNGVNWRQALKEAAAQPLDLQWKDGATGDTVQVDAVSLLLPSTIN